MYYFGYNIVREGLLSLELLKVIKEKVDRFRWNVKTLIVRIFII